MSISAETLREVVAAVTHVPGVSADLICTGGHVERVSAAPRGRELAVDLFRRAFERVGLHDADTVFDELRLLLPSRPSLALLHADSPRTVEISPTHWRWNCTCGVHDVFLSRLEMHDAVAAAEDELGGLLRAVPPVWVRPDPTLDLSVVVVERRDTLESGVDDQAIEFALERVGKRCGTHP